MQEIRKVLVLDRRSYYVTHLSLLNCLLPVTMTPMEVNVLAEFLALEGEITTYRFGPTARKVVMQELHLSPSGLSNYMRTLTDKGFLENDDGVLTVVATMLPEPLEQFFRVRLLRSLVPSVQSNNNNGAIIDSINEAINNGVQTLAQTTETRGML
jgi:hypothetical protein